MRLDHGHAGCERRLRLGALRIWKMCFLFLVAAGAASSASAQKDRIAEVAGIYATMNGSGLSVDFAEPDVVVWRGGIEKRTLKLTNHGSQAVEFFLEEIYDSVSQTLADAKPAMQPAWVKQHVKCPAMSTGDKTLHVAKKAPLTTKIAGDVFASWPSHVEGAYGVAYAPDDNSTDNSTEVITNIWVGSSIKGSLHGFGADGTPSGAVFTSPTGGPEKIHDLTFNWNSRTLWGIAGSGDSACIYEIEPTYDPDDSTIGGYTGERICINSTVSDLYGLAYDPYSDTYFAAGADKIIYRFDRTGAIKKQVDVSSKVDGIISGLACNPDTQHLFAIVPGVGSAPAKIHVLNAANDAYGITSNFTIEGFPQNGAAGLEMDCEGYLWAVDQVSGEVYQVDSGEQTSFCSPCPCCVYWLDEELDGEPITDGTIDAYSSLDIDVVFDATSPDIQAGVYRARLRINNLSSGKSLTIPVSMAVVDGDPLVVNLKPLGIAGQWQVDEDGVWRESGEILEVLPGEHIVSFSDVRGYLTPKPVTVIVAAGIAKTITGTYRPADTLLTVTLTPPAAVSRGAKWNVDNGAWKDSGTTVTLKTGTHTVRFKDIDGFETPKLQTVKIKQGQNATVTGEYPWNGSIKVTILPAAVVKKGAKWCVDGGAWQNSGKSVTVKAGAHVLSFKAVSGYATPEDRQVDVPAGEDITESVTYPPVGKLKVTILPAAVISKGAMWKVEGGAWQQSGKVLELAPGTYKVSFKNVTDYITPEPLSAKVHANTLTAKTGTYEQCGSLTVRITPPDAVKKGARWAVDGGAWQNSGAVVKNLAPGEHTVTFKAATGYKTPTQKSANIVSGKKTTVKVEYKK